MMPLKECGLSNHARVAVKQCLSAITEQTKQFDWHQHWLQPLCAAEPYKHQNESKAV